jgi:hypothetical protein
VRGCTHPAKKLFVQNVRWACVSLGSGVKLVPSKQDEGLAKMLYVQVEFSRSEGRSFTLGLTAYGEAALTEAREMARRLSQSVATDYIIVTVENRVGANSTDIKVYKWSRTRGWY